MFSFFRALSNANIRISGITYNGNNNYFYSGAYDKGIYNLNLNDSSQRRIASSNFPDGLDLYKNKLYVVSNDRSGILTILNTDGEQLSTLNTGISDITGITHTDDFLYILSEDGEIFQTNPTTGKSIKIFVNNNLFEAGNNNNGLEAITILNKKIYVSYINDTSIYLINIDLAQYE